VNVHALLALLADDLTQISAMIAAVLAIVATVRTFKTRRDLTAVRSEAETHTVQLDRVEHRWNGRLDEILAITREAAYQRGVADGLRQTLAQPRKETA
jgi:hypothetical protein